MTAADTISSAPATAVGTAVQKRAPSRRQRWFREVGWRHLVGVLALVFALFPVIWAFSASINPTGALASQKLIPADPSLKNYRWLFTHPNQPYPKWLLNSVVIGFAAAVGTVILAALAAFAFSRLRFKGRRAGLMTLLLVQMFPQATLMVALYLLIVNMGGVFPAVGLGTKLGLILVYFGGALGSNVWLIKGFFDTIPRELDESAKVDGASHAQTFFKIVLPLAAPVLAVIFLLSFITAINEYIIASILLRGNPEKFTLAYGLQQFVQGRDLNWGPFAAGALLAGIPVMILFLFLQRFLVSGLTQGAVKG